MFNSKKLNAYCINLKQRPDRKEAVWKEFKKHNLHVDLWEATCWKDVIVPDDSIKRHEYNASGILACAMSHVALIKHAKELNLDYITIFEDDIVLSDNFAEKIQYIESVPDNWDMFYLGCHSYVKIPTIYQDIYQVDVAAGTYGYIVKNTLYDFILDRWYYRYGIDEFYDYEVLKKSKALAIIPAIVTTQPNYSDVAQHFVNYHIPQ